MLGVLLDVRLSLSIQTTKARLLVSMDQSSLTFMPSNSWNKLWVREATNFQLNCLWAKFRITSRLKLRVMMLNFLLISKWCRSLLNKRSRQKKTKIKKNYQTVQLSNIAWIIPKLNFIHLILKSFQFYTMIWMKMKVILQ